MEKDHVIHSNKDLEKIIFLSLLLFILSIVFVVLSYEYSYEEANLKFIITPVGIVLLNIVVVIFKTLHYYNKSKKMLSLDIILVVLNIILLKFLITGTAQLFEDFEETILVCTIPMGAISLIILIYSMFSLEQYVQTHLKNKNH